MLIERGTFLSVITKNRNVVDVFLQQHSAIHWVQFVSKNSPRCWPEDCETGEIIEVGII